MRTQLFWRIGGIGQLMNNFDCGGVMGKDSIVYEFRMKDLVDYIAYELRKVEFYFFIEALSGRSINTYSTLEKLHRDIDRNATTQYLRSSISLTGMTKNYFMIMPISIAFILYIAPFELLPHPTRVFVFMMFGIFFGMIGLILLFCTLFLTQRVASGIVRREIEYGDIGPQYFGCHCLAMKENCLELQYGISHMKQYYTGIQKIVGYPKYTLILCKSLNRIIVPHTAFTDIHHRTSYFSRLQNAILEAKKFNISKYSIDENRESNYVVKITWDEKSFFDATTKGIRLMFTTRLGWSVGQIICLLIALILIRHGILVFFIFFTTSYSDLFFIISGVFSFLIAYVCLIRLIAIFTPIMKRSMMTKVRKGVTSLDDIGPVEVCYKNDRITALGHENKSDFMYGLVYCVKQDLENVYILLKGKKVIPIPNSEFRDDKQKQEIVSFIKNKIRRK
jgi:hypothetical protein